MTYRDRFYLSEPPRLSVHGGNRSRPLQRTHLTLSLSPLKGRRGNRAAIGRFSLNLLGAEGEAGGTPLEADSGID